MAERERHTPAESLAPFRSTQPRARSGAWKVVLQVGGGALSLAVLGILAVEASHTYLEVLPTTEGTNTVGRLSTLAIEAAARARSERGPTLCASARHPVPRELSHIQGSRHSHYHSSAADWTDGPPDSGFRCLRFTTSDPQFYQYDYSSTGPQGRFTAMARSDFDSFSQDGEVDPATMTVKIHSIVRQERPEN